MPATPFAIAAETVHTRRVEPSGVANAAVDLQAALLSQATLHEAGTAWARSLAELFGFDRVALGLCRHGDWTTDALTKGPAIGVGTPEFDRLRRVWSEALDQSATIVFPETRSAAHPRITLAHSRLHAGNAGTVVTLPLVAAGQQIGALTIARHTSPVSAQEVDTLEHLACLAAPVLQLMQLNQRSLAERLRDTLRQWWTDHGHRQTRRGAAFAALLLAAAVLVPLPWKIGGHARLEGAVQRVLVAPADGFLRKVNARPGEAVKAGQVLVELADQDLQLEQQRWQSTLAQHENAYAAANAHADRTQQVIHQSRAAEAEAQLALVQMKLERGRIAAPFDGLVVQGDLSQSLGAPLNQGAELMTLAPLGQFRVIVEVDERDIATIAVGQRGSLALSALPWDTLPIRVTRITPIATVLDGRNVFEVEAQLLAPDATLRPGLQGSAHIVVGHRPWLVSASRRLVDGARRAWWEWWG
jgi:hypothetical protein